MSARALVWWLALAWIGWAAVGGAGRRAARRRLARIEESSATPRRRLERPSMTGIADDIRVRFGLCVIGGAFAGWWLLGTIGLPVGLVAGLGIAVWAGRTESASVRREREELRSAMPMIADLLAACTAAGNPLGASLEVVARSHGGAARRQLQRLAASHAFGVAGEIDSSDPLAPLERAIARSLRSGAPLAAGLSRLASDVRRDLDSERQAKARSVGVKAAAPLALCFLPAFMMVGVVPTVVSAFGDLFR